METGKFSDNMRGTDNGLVSGVEFYSRRILHFRTSAIDLIHSERVSTSRSSFFAHRLAYSSHAFMTMPKFWCHEYKTSKLIQDKLFWWYYKRKKIRTRNVCNKNKQFWFCYCLVNFNLIPIRFAFILKSVHIETLAQSLAF